MGTELPIENMLVLWAIAMTGFTIASSSSRRETFLTDDKSATPLRP